MIIMSNESVTVFLQQEAKDFYDINETDAYYQDYRRDDKLKLQPEIEKLVIARIRNVHPTADNFKIKIKDTENLTVNVKFTREI